MDLKLLITVLWRRKWILILVPVVAVFAAFFVRLFGDWKYKSTAQLATGLTISDELVGKGEYLNPYEIQVTFNNLIEIIRSRSVVGQVSYRLLEHDLTDSINSFRSLDEIEIQKTGVIIDILNRKGDFINILKSKIDSLILLNPNHPEEKTIQKVIDEYNYDYESIADNLVVYRVNQSDFLEVSFTSENPSLSAFVVNTVCSEFIRYYSLSKTSRSSASIASFESIVSQRKAYLDSKLKEFEAFKTRNELFNSEAESDAKLRQIKNYEEQIAQEEQKIRALELTLANLNLRIKDAEANSSLQNYDQIVILRRQITGMNDRYIRGGQSDTRLLDSLTILREQLNEALARTNEGTKVTPAELKELKNRRDEGRVELEISRENLNSLNKIYGSIRYGLSDFASKESLGKSLEKEVDVAREEYTVALNRLNEAKEQFVTNKMSISQVLVAEPAEKAESRKTLVFMILSGGVSFFVCVFSVIGIELADSRIKSPQRFKQLTRLKLAGILPKLPEKDFEWDIDIKSSGRKNRSVNDEIRKVRFEIESYAPRIVLVTSARERQGKSFFIIALAFSLSLLKKRVLIVDTNFRNNSLTRTLTALPNLSLLIERVTKGAKLLGNGNKDNSGEKNATPNTQYDPDMISKTENEWIDIIGNQKSVLSPSELIPGGDFKVLLGWLMTTYDHIILEGSAMNEFSDTKELVQFADLIVPVFSAESSINQKDIDSINYLKGLQGKIGPAILNMVEINKVV
jgi:polysaccharide biosynthesis transport protein